MALGRGTAIRQAEGKRFVSDIFREVDEEVRREQLKKLWERYGDLHHRACVLLVVAVGGWRGYEWWEAQEGGRGRRRLRGRRRAERAGQARGGRSRLRQARRDGTASYRMLAKLREAGELAQRDPKAAVAIYDQLAADRGVGQVLQDLAALRAGLILVDTAPYEELRRRLEPLTAPDRDLPPQRARAAGARGLARQRHARRCGAGPT